MIRWINKLAEDEALVKFVFDHIRNLGLCALIISAGNYWIETTGKEAWYEVAIGVSFFATGLFLYVLNGACAFDRMSKMKAPLWVWVVLPAFYSQSSLLLLLFLLRASGK